MMLFIALVFLNVTSSSAQNCPIIDSDSVVITHICDTTVATANDGVIELVLINPLGNYSFLWRDANGVTIGTSPAVTTTVTNLAEGTYTVRITDNDPLNPGCFQLDTFTITEPQDPLSSTVNLYQNVLCFGDSTGIAFADVIGGTLPYTYLWDNGQTTQIANTLWAGSVGPGVGDTIYHTVTFTDGNGCTLIDSVPISNLHPEIVGIVNIVQNVSCFGACDGIAELSVIGGITPYDFDWDVGQTYHGSGPNTAFNLCYGGHDIIILDGVGCREIVSFNITQPDELFTQAVQDQPVQCYGFDDGESSAWATGGTTPYSFGWIDINGDTVVGETGQTIDSLTPGIHTIYIIDDNGCTAFDTVVIYEPTQLEVIIAADSTVYSYCAGTNSGKLCAIASGGTPSYIYLWNDVLLQNTPCATDLSAQFNDYTIVVMDDRDCIATASFQLDSITNSLNPDSVLRTINDVSCFGLFNGSIEINTVVGGVQPYDYSWTGPGTYTGTGSLISSLYAGSYAVIIEDHNGCAITVNAEVDEPDLLEYTTYNVFSETCYGACDGQISVNVQGGTGNYYFDESQTGVFPISSANQLQLINDSLILNLCSDVHSIYVTDDNNCEAAVAWGGTWQETVGPGVVVDITGFPPVSTNSSVCFNTNDGQAFITEPNPLFTYTWETTAGTIIDTGVGTLILYPGNYNVVVHYADSASFGQIYSSCDLVHPFTVNGPTPLLANATVTDVSCFGLNDGEILLSPTSPALGTPTVLWDTTTSIPGSSTSSSQSPLQPGTYTVTITDADGCTITNDIIVEEPEAITASISFDEPLCYNDNNGSATIIVQGGVPIITYNWLPSGGNASTANNISAGVYTVNVADGNGCLENFWVDVTQPDEIIASLEPNLFYNEDNLGNPYHISCFGFSDGSAIVANGGGVPPITYSWTSGGFDQQETGIAAGPVTVTVTDGNNCSESQTITLVEPAYLEPNIFENIYSTSTNGITNEISCYGMSDGWVESQTFGGVETPNEPYQYLWVNDNTGQIVSTHAIAKDLPANFAYTVTVTDANGCVSQATTTILDEPVPFIADVTTTNYGGPNHAPFTTNFVDNTISNDPFDFSWTWEDGTSSYTSGTLTFDHEFVVENIGENNVYVIVTNLATSCFDSVPFIINVQGIPEIKNVFTPNGDQYNNEFYFGEHSMINIDVQVFNRWGQLVYSWNGENKSWNGKGADGQDLPEAVYFYVLKAEGADGHYYDEKGSVTLLR